jgi:glycosidase
MSHQNHTDTFTTPEWVHHAVFYQIFPERFDNGDPTNDPENVQPWGTRPAFYNYMGGDLRGIINHLDYLSDLGVTALYLNPIFHAHSNHKYNTYDYFRIDPHFGTLETYHELIKQAHQRDIRVILDGVFNHCGRGFYAFYDIVETGDNSSYRNWFHIFKLPIHPFTEKEPANYAGWWNLRSLPKFNTDHPPVRRYLLDVARYWIEQGADGWRLDVPNEIADHEFWREFRQTVKQANPEAYIVGEIWEDAHPWLDGSQFDGVMNYIWRDLCRDFFAYGKIDGGAFAAGIDNLLGRYPRPATLAQLNLLGSHDTARFITEAHNDISRLYPTILFQMTFPGAPCIYYGDEIGMQGGKDPDCRRCFPWNQQQWNHDLRAWVQRCVTLRHNNPALRTGEYRTLWGENTLYGFGRWNDEQQFVIIINAHDHPTQIDMPLHDMPLPHHGRLRDLLSDRTYEVHDRHVRGVQVPARRGVVLTRAE